MCKVYTGYCGTSEIEHGLCACTVDNPLAKARGLSLRTGAQTMLYLSLKFQNTFLHYTGALNVAGSPSVEFHILFLSPLTVHPFVCPFSCSARGIPNMAVPRSLLRSANIFGSL